MRAAALLLLFAVIIVALALVSSGIIDPGSTKWFGADIGMARTAPPPPPPTVA